MNEEELEVKAKEYSVKKFDTVWNIAVKVYKAGYRACTKEVKQLGERCNQLLKDKGALLDQIDRMKCGQNCKYEYWINTGGCYDQKCRFTGLDCTNCKDKWKGKWEND